MTFSEKWIYFVASSNRMGGFFRQFFAFWIKSYVFCVHHFWKLGKILFRKIFWTILVSHFFMHGAIFLADTADLVFSLLSGQGICSSVFQQNRSFFAQKLANEGLAQKNERFAHSLIFGERPEWLLTITVLISSEQPEQIAHGDSFLVSNLSDLLTLLISCEWPEWFAHIAHQKRGNDRIAHFCIKKAYTKHTKK